MIRKNSNTIHLNPNTSTIILNIYTVIIQIYNKLIGLDFKNSALNSFLYPRFKGELKQYNWSRLKIYQYKFVFWIRN